MDCTYVPCAKYGLDCMHTTVNPRIVPGGMAGKAWIVCMIIVCTKPGQPGLRHAELEKGYHSYMQAFATEY